MNVPVLHIISHTDLDGVTAAALAWHWHSVSSIVKVSLCGYGEVDNLITDCLTKKIQPIVLDLSCQREQTADDIDAIWDDSRQPFLFDHHKSTQEKYGNRKWANIDTNYCGALVYWNYLQTIAESNQQKKILSNLEPLIRIANDRDLWLLQMPESNLWQSLVTLYGPWGAFTRLAANPCAKMTQLEAEAAKDFTNRQAKRFSLAMEHVVRTDKELAFLNDGENTYLDFGDASDFCGQLLDRDKTPPQVAAIAFRRKSGDWAVSLRSRNGTSLRVLSLLSDGKKVRGGGHGDAAAIYFPARYTAEEIRESIMAAIKVERERSQKSMATLGDLFKLS